ncbi:MAG: hypothetical protein LBD11_08925 [Candidatus Peribacteria bacterium]|jgi:hypothetical protein|nr:hypothetical protein [Candidatus Peribacteria bacterium]
MELEAKNQQIKAEQLEQAKKRLKTFEGNIDQQATFSCDKIGTNCPFIKVINKQHFEQLEKQKAVLKEEIENIEKSLVFVPLSGDEDPTGRIEGGVDEPSIAEVKKATEEGVMKIKTFLTDINFKSREDTYAKKETLQKLINEKDQNIMRLEIETHKLQDYQQQKTAFQTSLQHLEVQIQEKMKEIEKIKADQAQLDQQISEYHPETLQAHLQTLTRILQIIHDIQQLIADATSTKNLVKDLQQQEKFLTNLYTILSKELLLFALEEYLPVLSEIINSYLIQVVDYQIAMKITETAEKLELEAKIYDEKGEREVKSLS